MKILWSLPVPGENFETSTRGDVIRARSLVQALRRSGHEVVVEAAGAQAGTGAVVAAYRGWIRRVLPEGGARLLRDLGRVVMASRHARCLSARAAEERPDLLIETQVGFFASGATAARRAGLPLVLDDCAPSSEEAEKGSPLPWLARRMLERQARVAVRLIAPTASARETLVDEGLPRARITVVPNGVDLEAFAAAGRSEIRHRLGLADACVVGFHGSFQRWHRVDLLVDAVGRMSNRDDVSLLLVGDGPTRGEILPRIEALGLARLTQVTGAVSHDLIPGLVAAMDVGVLPGSNSYGHPMKLIEFAAASLAIVAPDLPVVQEVIRPEENGLVFPPGDVRELSRCLERLITDADLRTGLGRAARDEIGSGSSWDEAARRILPH